MGTEQIGGANYGSLNPYSLDLPKPQVKKIYCSDCKQEVRKISLRQHKGHEVRYVD